jgi:ATP-binding cassette, subfamily B, bacterial
MAQYAMHVASSPGTGRPNAMLRSVGRDMARALRIVWRTSPAGVLTLGLLTSVAAASAPAIAYTAKVVIDAVVAAQATAAGPGTTRVALLWVAVEFVLITLASLVDRVLTFTRQLIGARLSVSVNMMILRSALDLKLAHFEDSEFYDKLTRAQREAASRPLALLQDALLFLRSTLTLSAYVVLLLAFSPWIVVLLLVTTIPAFISEAKFSSESFRLRNWRSPKTRELSYLEFLIVNDQHAKELRLFGLGSWLLSRYHRIAETFHHELLGIAGRRALWGWALSVVAMLAFYACYGAIVLDTIGGSLSLGDMALYVMTFRQGQQSFQSILSAIGSIHEHALYVSNLFGFLDMSAAHSTSRAERQVRAASMARADVDERGIRFEGVGFQYPGTKKWVLENVHLWIPAGQTVALVGPNGAGKTTLVKLLTGLYEPTAGRILLDGIDIRAWDESAFLARLGVIFQDFNRYHLRLRENIGLGSIDHLEDTRRVAAAAEQAGATEVVASLPAGFESQLGQWFEGGIELSGGQWQKVALARAFMRPEADVLVLDEPSAALDAATEHMIAERIRALSRNRTTILVSHRLRTVRMANRILVLNDGRIAEDGPHSTLLASGGPYARIFALQAEAYA